MRNVTALLLAGLFVICTAIDNEAREKRRLTFGANSNVERRDVDLAMIFAEADALDRIPRQVGVGAGAQVGGRKRRQVNANLGARIGRKKRQLGVGVNANVGKRDVEEAMMFADADEAARIPRQVGAQVGANVGGRKRRQVEVAPGQEQQQPQQQQQLQGPNAGSRVAQEAFAAGLNAGAQTGGRKKRQLGANLGSMPNVGKRDVEVVTSFAGSDEVARATRQVGADAGTQVGRKRRQVNAGVNASVGRKKRQVGVGASAKVGKRDVDSVMQRKADAQIVHQMGLSANEQLGEDRARADAPLGSHSHINRIKRQLIGVGINPLLPVGGTEVVLGR